MSRLKAFILCLSTAIVTAAFVVSLYSIHPFKYVTELYVDGPKNAVKGDLIEFKAQVKNPSWFLYNTVYQWKVLNKDNEIPFRSVDNTNILLPAGTIEGKIFVICSAVNYYNYILWGESKPLNITVNPVTIGNNPNPDPGPIPPTPTPTPVTEQLYAVAVFDSSAALSWTPDQLQLHNSTTIQNSLKGLNVIWKNYDKANPAISDPKWQQVINTVGSPALIVVDKSGKNYYNEKLVSEADTVTQIKTLRGVK